MKSVNPRYVLRNWMAESATRKAETNDFSEVVLLHDVLGNPFIAQDSAEETGYAARPPLWGRRLKKYGELGYFHPLLPQGRLSIRGSVSESLC
ncbi:protein adenylyltransferase SelO-like [Gadus chalcogrammus]|uniref:protein adenylyltransferase SelO-like n=1 Tax=Gadus chalcogrammus TaxID=1042646 RepID=UPI0024C48D68|nr:protein adenylyltransferase SelO-like [Gadus chalcogrammus]